MYIFDKDKVKVLDIHLISRVTVYNIHTRVHEVGTFCTDLLEVKLSLLPASTLESHNYSPPSPITPLHFGSSSCTGIFVLHIGLPFSA